MNRLKYFIKLMRPQQWYKNLVVFIGIIFSKRMIFLNLWYDVLSVFALLCIFSGITYVINDIIDLKRDEKHPEKRNRPLVSGKIKKNEAVIGASLLFILATYWSFSLDLKTFFGLLIFFTIGLFYNFYLKNIFLIDIITISILFILRAIIGVIVIDVVITPWLILCTFLLALLLALGKRRRELEVLKEDSIAHREVLRYYSLEVINPLVISTLAMLFVSYCIYSVLTETGKYMVITIPVVTYLLFRYSYFIFSVSNIPSSPEMVFKDKGMLSGILLWILLVLVSLYVT